MKAPACLFFPLKGNSLLRLGPGGVVTLLVMDSSSWPPVPQLPPSTSIFTSAQACPQRSKVTSERARLGSGPYARSMQFTEHSQTLRPSRRQVNTSPALTEPLPEHLGALFPADFPSVKSARQGGGCPGPQGADPPSRLQASLGPPGLNRAGGSQEVRCGGGGNSSTHRNFKTKYRLTRDHLLFPVNPRQANENLQQLQENSTPPTRFQL